jgi:hypothetical protein
VAGPCAGWGCRAVAGARANRALLRRAVTHLARDGVRQFLDLGAGLPTKDNVHDIAQRVHPDARTVYVDHDSIVILHARALLVRDEQTAAVQADLHSVRPCWRRGRNSGGGEGRFAMPGGGPQPAHPGGPD